MIELADMTAFVAVVETSSFTDAARRLGTTKSVISRRISDMEHTLGAPLLDRSSRSVRATEVGAVYYAKCVRILESVGAANDFVSSHHQLVRGRLRIAVPGEVGAHLLLPLLSAFSEQYSDVVLDIEISDVELPHSDSHYDVAWRTGRLNDASFIAKPLMSYRRWLCAAPTYLQARGTPESLDQLPMHDALLDAIEDQGGDTDVSGKCVEVLDAIEDGNGAWLLQDAENTHAIRARERLRSSRVSHLLDAAIQGLGLVLAPAPLIAAPLRAGTLRRVLPQFSGPLQPVSLVYPKSRRASPKLHSLLNFVSERIPDAECLP